MSPLRTRAVAAAVVTLLLLGACGARASAEQLEWCALNQAQVGRSATELGLFGDPITFSEWKESNPEDYERSCVHAFERR